MDHILREVFFGEHSFYRQSGWLHILSLLLCFFEVCTYSDFGLQSYINMDLNIPAMADIRIFDVYERAILDWTQMSDHGSSNERFTFEDVSISARPSEQENIIWVEMRITVDIENASPEQIHELLSEDLWRINVNLKYHKPKTDRIIEYRIIKD
jgi:hypothetical protein